MSRRKRNGAWGYGAMESDAAYDWVNGVMGPVVVQIEEVLRPPLSSGRIDYEAARIRTAAYLLEQVGYEAIYPSTSGLASRFDTDSVLCDHLQLAIEKLLLIAADQEYAASWEDPAALRAAINQQIQALENRLQDPSAPRTRTLLDTLSDLEPELKTKLLR